MQARFQCVSYLGKCTPFLSFPWHKINAGIRWTHDSFLRRLGLCCEPVQVGTTFRHWAPIWLLLSQFKEQLKDVEQWKIRIFKLRLCKFTSSAIFILSYFTHKNKFIPFFFCSFASVSKSCEMKAKNLKYLIILDNTIPFNVQTLYIVRFRVPVFYCWRRHPQPYV